MTEPNDPLAPLGNSAGVGVMRYYLQQAGYPNVGDLDAFIRERDALCALLREREQEWLARLDAGDAPLVNGYHEGYAHGELGIVNDARDRLRAIRTEAP